MKSKDNYKKEKKKLELRALESNWLKIVGFLMWQFAIASIYYSFNKNIENLTDISLILMGINLTIVSINISVYFSIHKQMLKEIDNIKSYNGFDDECKLLIKIYQKKLNLTLYQIYISGFSVIISSIAVLIFNFTPLINNIISVFAFAGTINLLTNLLFLIKALNKVYISKEKIND